MVDLKSFKGIAFSELFYTYKINIVLLIVYAKQEEQETI